MLSSEIRRALVAVLSLLVVSAAAQSALAQDSDGDGLSDAVELNVYGTDPFSPDSDGGGLLDGAEVLLDGTDPLDGSDDLFDIDLDGLSDEFEQFTTGTNPFSSDTDGGGLSDGLEVFNGSDPLNQLDDFVIPSDSDGDGIADNSENLIYNTSPFNSDTDADGLFDGSEVFTYGTDPTESDSDNDTLPDADELFTYGTDPNRSDSDFDGLGDADELFIYNTDPQNFDTDFDGLGDREEIDNFTDPLNPDTDGDFLTDGEEVIVFGTDPLNPDTDGDELTDNEEVFVFGTDPLNEDTDADGLRDDQEVRLFFTDPLIADTDFDGLLDGEEVNLYGTNPFDPDTDGGGVSDGDEVMNGTDPVNPLDDNAFGPCGFVNHSFETGDFSGWIVKDLNVPFSPLSVDASTGTNPLGSNWGAAATDGIHTAFHGFDGDGASSGFPISIAQDVLISQPGLVFDWRAGWSMFAESLDRTFDVVIRPAGGGAEIARYNILTAEGGSTTQDSGQTTSLIDLSDFLGMTVRVSFEWTIPENFTGPAQFQLDNICQVELEVSGFVNPSFETGDFTGWLVQDLDSPFEPLRVDASTGYNPGFGFLWGTAATDGLYTAYHGFDGAGASSGFPISIAQDVLVSQPNLSFDWRAAWDLVSFGAPENLDRTFDVVIRPFGGGVEFARYSVLVVPGFTQNSDTGQQTSVIDLSVFLNQVVRVSFEWTVPEDSTGPAHLQFDNVNLSEPPCLADTNGDGILDNGDIITFVQLFLAGDPSADTNGDGILDNGDIITFVSLFLAGC